MANLQNLTEQHILNAMGFDYLPEEDRALLMDDIVEVINQKMLLRIFQSVSPEDQKILASILNKSPEKFEDFVAEKIPHFLDILGEEIDAMKQQLLSYAKA